MTEPQFVIVRGGFRNGFTVIGPVPTERLAYEWLRPLHNDGDVMELLSPQGYEGKTGKHGLIVGDPIKGFSVFGVFLHALSAVYWRNTQTGIDNFWVVELDEYFRGEVNG